MRLLLSVLTIISLTTFSQSPSFKPAPYQGAISPDLLAKLKQRNTTDWSLATLPPEADKKVAKTAYQKEFDNLVKAFSTDHLVVNTDINFYLQDIIERIADTNEMPEDWLSVYVYRSDIPNAASLGSGVITVMLGMLAMLETEDQVAFVLAHEAAHVVAMHNLKSIGQYAVANNKENAKKINQAQRSVYNSYTQTTGLLENAERGYLRHSRSFEFTADSLALVFYLRAGYHPAQALRTLELLDNADEDQYADLDVTGTFPISAPRRAEMYSELAKLRHDVSRPDSLSTHPNCVLRGIALRKQLQELSVFVSQPYKAEPNQVREMAALNMVEGEFHFNHLGKSLYHSIYLAARYPGRYYLQAMIGRSLYEILIRQKQHTLGTSVDHPDPRYPETYNKVLSLVQQLRLTELEELTFQFMAMQPDKAFEDEHFLFALWQISQLKTSNLDPDMVREDYVTKFPTGMYLSQLK